MACSVCQVSKILTVGTKFVNGKNVGDQKFIKIKGLMFETRLFIGIRNIINPNNYWCDFNY